MKKRIGIKVEELSDSDFIKFWSRVEMSDIDECWRWTPGKPSTLYGSFFFKKRSVGAHRVAYQCFNGDLSVELVVDHMCRNKRCVNPRHLRQVTQKINTTENSVSNAALNARKTHCPSGHEYSGTNLIFHKRGGRLCRICKNISACKSSKKARK